MEKLDCRIVHTLTGIWLTTPARRLGPVPATEPTPDSYVLVEKAGTPALRIDVYLKPDALYRETMALHWGDWIAVGCSDSVYLVPLTDTSVREVSLGDSGPWDYFSGFWPTDEILLAVSGRGLVRIEPDGSVRWRNDNLGLDGIDVKSVSAGAITGLGDWDPPGGWKPFEIDTDTGAALLA